MGPYAFSQAFVSGCFAFASVTSLLLWLRTRKDWTLLLLWAVCAIGAVQSIAVLVLATTDGLPEARIAQRVRVLCGLASFASLAWLYAEISGVRARAYLWFVTALAAAVVIIIFVQIPLLGGEITGITRVTLPWGESFSLLERMPSRPMVPVIYAVMASTVGFNILCARRFMAHNRVGAILLIVATLGSLVPLVSSALIDITSAPIPYIGTLGAAAFVLVIALQLAVSRRRDEQLLAAERARRALEQRLAQAQKMEALGQLAGGVAHDFNNVLTVIGGHADMLLATASEEARTDLEQIRLATTRAASMTGQLLAFSRKSIMEPTILDLNTVIGDINMMLRRTVGEQIELTVRGAPDLWHVRADTNQLTRVLVNLAINARDAMPNGGRVTIETANVFNVRSGDDSSAPQSGRFVLVSIADTGEGMSDETKAHVFEPFFTTKSAGKGTGLGLAVVDGIVRQTGGYIEVQSRIGQGTVFRLFFPASPEPTIQPAPIGSGESAGVT